MGHSSRGWGAALLGLLTVIQVVGMNGQTLSTGSLAVSWDVVKSSIKEYTVVVRLRNNQLINPVPAPGWALSWTWQQSEMVETVDGAQVLNLADCSGTSAAADFPDKVWYAVTCAASPIFVSTVNQGYLPAASVDNVNNTAQFTIVLGKGSDYWGVGNLSLPSNFDIGLPGYQCTLPAPAAAGRSVPVSIGARQYYTALQSYDFTCALSPQFVAKPTCCVSFSGFFNNTVATCPACACGCNASLGSNSTACASRQSGPNAATQLLFGPALLPSSSQQISSKQTLDAAPRPCSSGCMTDIHFAVSQEFGGGWQVQVAIANTRATPIADWLLAMDLPLANYLEAVYTVQHDAARQLPNFAIFSGQPYYNDVISSAPGNVQWIMNFNKTAVAPATGPKIKIVDQNAFPTAVYFMGQQCALPPFDAIPSNVLGQTSGAVGGRQHANAALLVAALVALLAVLL